MGNGYSNIIYIDDKTPDQYRVVTLPIQELLLPRGASEMVIADVFPNFDNPVITWASSNPEVVTVEGGTVAVVGRGTAVITATVDSASAEITVKGYIAPESFDFPEEEWVQTEKTLQLCVSNLVPEDADAVFVYNSDDTDVATVDENGLVTARKPGTTVIAATSNGISRECLVHVCYPVTDLSVDEENIAVPAGEDVTLVVHVTAREDHFDNHFVEFNSSDERIATVNEKGVVHGLKVGTVTITAVAESEISTSVTCTVLPCEVHTPVGIPGILPTKDKPGLTTGIRCEACETVLFAQETLDSVTTVTLPEKLNAIGSSAFEKIAAQYAVVPNGCTAIGNLAFADTPNLSFVRIPESVILIADDAFPSISDLTNPDAKGKAHPITFVGAASEYVKNYAETHGIPIIPEPEEKENNP